jgi:hypothetical protein
MCMCLSVWIIVSLCGCSLSLYVGRCTLLLSRMESKRHASICQAVGARVRVVVDGQASSSEWTLKTMQETLISLFLKHADRQPQHERTSKTVALKAAIATTKLEGFSTSSGKIIRKPTDDETSTATTLIKKEGASTKPVESLTEDTNKKAESVKPVVVEPSSLHKKDEDESWKSEPLPATLQQGRLYFTFRHALEPGLQSSDRLPFTKWPLVTVNGYSSNQNELDVRLVFDVPPRVKPCESFEQLTSELRAFLQLIQDSKFMRVNPAVKWIARMTGARGRDCMVVQLAENTMIGVLLNSPFRHDVPRFVRWPQWELKRFNTAHRTSICLYHFGQNEHRCKRPRCTGEHDMEKLYRQYQQRLCSINIDPDEHHHRRPVSASSRDFNIQNRAPPHSPRHTSHSRCRSRSRERDISRETTTRNAMSRETTTRNAMPQQKQKPVAVAAVIATPTNIAASPAVVFHPPSLVSWPSKAILDASPLVSVQILPHDAVLLPCDSMAHVNKNQPKSDCLESADLLATHSLIIESCKMNQEQDSKGMPCTDYDRMFDAQEWTLMFEKHKILSADTPLAFILRREHDKLQLAFLSKQARDTVQTRLAGVARL